MVKVLNCTASEHLGPGLSPTDVCCDIGGSMHGLYIALLHSSSSSSVKELLILFFPCSLLAISLIWKLFEAWAFAVHINNMFKKSDCNLCNYYRDCNKETAGLCKGVYHTWKMVSRDIKVSLKVRQSEQWKESESERNWEILGRYAQKHKGQRMTVLRQKPPLHYLEDQRESWSKHDSTNRASLRREIWCGENMIERRDIVWEKQHLGFTSEWHSRTGAEQISLLLISLYTITVHRKGELPSQCAFCLDTAICVSFAPCLPTLKKKCLWNTTELILVGDRQLRR